MPTDYRAEVLKRRPSARVQRAPVALTRIVTNKGPLGDWRFSEAEAWESAFLKLVEGAMK